MDNMKELAAKYAERAHQHDFDQRFGTHRVDELQPPRLCFFNNNSYKEKVLVRERQTAEFEQRLAQIGIAKLGYAEFPDSGVDEGYSYALILDAPPQMAKRVLDMWREVFVTFGWDDTD